jgi:uncharacterized small protein (DUF1192 family)
MTTDEKDHLEVKLGELRLEMRIGFEQLRTEMAALRAEMNRLHAETFKWMMGLFAGLYGAVVLGYFLK